MVPCRDGPRHVRATYIPDRDSTGKVQGFFSFVTDITQQKRIEAAYRFLAEASSTLAAVVDYESTLRKVARLAVPFFADWCVVDMVESDGSLRRLEVVHADPSRVELAQTLHRDHPPRIDDQYGAANVVRTGKPEMAVRISDEILQAAARDAEHLAVLRDLALVSYISVPLVARGVTLGVITFITSESGREYGDGDLALAHDLADRAAVAIDNARLYAELREADRLKDEFLAMLAHELRNPLAPIRNALHVMKMPGADPPILEQVQDMAERQVQHMARLLDDLLDVSRISRGKIELRKELIDVVSVANRTVEAIRSLIEDRFHRLTIELPAEPLRIEGDPTRLEQIFTNLLNNAAKYTDPGGLIVLSIVRDGNWVVVRVRDNGIGIAGEMLPRIFDLFVQAERRLDRSQGGVGIGLTLVRRLVELHDGTIEAFSAGLGEGSEFVVRFPLASNESRSSRLGDGLPAIGGSIPTRRILVVDDNHDAADSLAMMLRLTGQKVRAAYSGSEALQAVDLEPFDLIFLDIGMPGMDGYEVAARIRRNPKVANVTLIAMTGWGQEEDRRRTRQAGFHHHLVKPVEPATLQKFLLGELNL